MYVCTYVHMCPSLTSVCGRDKDVRSTVKGHLHCQFLGYILVHAHKTRDLLVYCLFIIFTLLCLAGKCGECRI